MITDSPPIHRHPDQGIWISWQGSPAQLLGLGRETYGRYCLSLGTSPVDGSAPPHRHDFEEGFYLLKGSLTFIAGNETHVLHEGDFIHIGANVAHAIRNESGQVATALTFCAPAGFDQFQMDGGYPIEGPESDLVPNSEAVRSRILASAITHGVDMSPPASAFEEIPRAHVSRKGEGDIIDVVGDRYRFIAQGEQTNGRYALWEAIVFPGGGPPPHLHQREDEAFYVLDGEITFFTPEASFVAGSGDYVHLPLGGRHWFRNETDQPARVLIFSAPAGLEKMFYHVGIQVATMDAPRSLPKPDEKQVLGEIAGSFGLEIGLGKPID
jgi:quercetin dioxygenase-like cupin family protein